MAAGGRPPPAMHQEGAGRPPPLDDCLPLEGRTVRRGVNRPAWSGGDERQLQPSQPQRDAAGSSNGCSDTARNEPAPTRVSAAGAKSDPASTSCCRRAAAERDRPSTPPPPRAVRELVRQIGPAIDGSRRCSSLGRESRANQPDVGPGRPSASARPCRTPGAAIDGDTAPPPPPPRHLPGSGAVVGSAPPPARSRRLMQMTAHVARHSAAARIRRVPCMTHSAAACLAEHGAPGERRDDPAAAAGVWSVSRRAV